MTKLEGAALEAEVAKLDGWVLEGGEIVRVYEFTDFLGSMKFVNQAAEAAEKAGHHPDIDIRYSKVKMALVTHDAGGVTSKDVALAITLNDLAI